MYKKSASEINIDLLKKHELDDYLTSLSMDDKELKYLDEQRLLLKILGNKPHLAIQLLIHLDWYKPQSAFQLAQKISEEYGRDLIIRDSEHIEVFNLLNANVARE